MCDFTIYHNISQTFTSCFLGLGGLAGINCHCQWGLTGLLGGIVIMLAAGQGVPKTSQQIVEQ